MKVEHDAAKSNTEDAWHFIVYENDDGTGRSTPVAVSTYNLEGMARRLGFAGTVQEYAERIALNQAAANFAMPVAP